MMDFNFKVIGLVAGVLFKPLALATEPFFRKNLGERYLTRSIVMLALGLWLAASGLSGLFASHAAPRTHYTRGVSTTIASLSKINTAKFLGGVIAGVFLALASVNIDAARQRQKNGIRWHSLSRGQSLWGIESPKVDWAVSIIAGVVLLKFALLTGLLFLASRLASRHLARKEQESLYARYLDQVDAELEMNHGEAALIGGSPPQATAGVYGPLPGRFQGEQRAHVAKVIAGGASGIGGKADSGTPTITLPPRRSAKTRVSRPDSTTQGTSNIDLACMAHSKGLLLVLCFAVLSAVCVGAGRAIHASSLFTKRSTDTAPMANAETIRPQPAIPAPSPAAQTAIQRQPQTAAVSPATRDYSAGVFAQVNAAMPQVGDKSETIRATEQKPSEQELARATMERQKQQERTKAAQQFTNTVAHQMQVLSELKADCLSRFHNNTRAIAGLSPPDKESWNKSNEDLQRAIAIYLQRQVASLSLSQILFQWRFADQKADLEKENQELAELIQSQELSRRSITQCLGSLETNISHALRMHAALSKR